MTTPRPRMWITAHAVIRFMERIAEGEVSTFEEARTILAREAKTARRVRDRALQGGRWRYICEALGCEMVVVRHSRSATDLVCLTVLPRKDSDEQAWHRELQRYAEDERRWLDGRKPWQKTR